MKRIIPIFLLLFLTLTMSFAQEDAISGIVKEKNSESPLFGVEIYTKNTNEGTISDFNGSFRIAAKKGDEIIIILE
jgi:hypothetical protein